MQRYNRALTHLGYALFIPILMYSIMLFFPTRTTQAFLSSFVLSSVFAVSALSVPLWHRVSLVTGWFVYLACITLDARSGLDLSPKTILIFIALIYAGLIYVWWTQSGERAKQEFLAFGPVEDYHW